MNASHMFSNCSPPLSCVVYGAASAQRSSVAGVIRGLHQIEQIVEVSDLADLKNVLAADSYNFALILLSEDDDSLPACLLRYPEMKTLVLTATRKVGPIDFWLKQGVVDAVSVQRPNKYRHAIRRLAEESRVHAALRTMSERLDSQSKLQQLLMDSTNEAIVVWQDGQILMSNQRFDELIGSHFKDNVSRSIEWKRWLCAKCFGKLHTRKKSIKGRLLITNHRRQRFKAHVDIPEQTNHACQIIRIDPVPLPQNTTDEKRLDSATGVLLPDAFKSAMDSWLGTTKQTRYTIVQIHVNEPDLLIGQSRANNTVQELLTYRISALLQKTFKDGALMGRTGPTTLAMLPLNTNTDTRELANQIRERLGTVGELVEDTSRIRIKTLTLSPSTLRSHEILERLDQPPMLTRRIAKPQQILSFGS